MRLQYPPSINIVRVPCTGKVDVLHILRALKEVVRKGNKLTINWYYEEGDDDIMERGEYYESILEIKFNFIETR